MALNSDALTSVKNARAWIGDPNADQTRLEILINDASRSVRTYCERQFKPVEEDVEKIFRYSGNGLLALPKTELQSVETITLFSDQPAASQIELQDAAGNNESDWRLEPRQGTLEGTFLELVLPLIPATAYRQSASSSGYPPAIDIKGIEVMVKGDWGAGVVPADVEAAVLIAVEHSHRNSGSFASRSVGASSVVDFGDQMFGDGGALPHGSLQRLARYRRDRYL